MCFAHSSEVFSQNKFTVSGYFSDAASGEQLIGVNVYDENSGLGTSANAYGFYSLTLPAGELNLRITFVGYSAQGIRFTLAEDTVLNMSLAVDAVEFQEVVVTADQSKVDQSQMSMVDIPIQKLNKIPAIMGEPDVLKVIQLLPGVQSGTEGTSGIYVRGGGADQNLFLLDGVPVYNASHLFGFFSVFNPGSVKTVKLYKGGFPARYGGRLSSVVDIRMKEGDAQKFKGDVSVGLISSKINLEGPIVKDKTSFLVSARRTYIDVLAQPIMKMTMEGFSEGYYFYDFNAKINHKFSDKSRLYLSTYMGKDKLYSDEEYSFEGDNSEKLSASDNLDLNWGNKIAALRFNYLLSNKLFSNTTLTYSSYDFGTLSSSGNVNHTLQTEEFSSSSYTSSIRDVAAKVDFDYFPHPNHIVKFGTGLISHQFAPGAEQSNFSSSEDPQNNLTTKSPDNEIRADEYYMFAEDNITIGERLKVNLGLHYSGFAVENEFYTSLQPRASMRFKVRDNWSLKASYSKMNQYVHLLSTSTIDLPTDLWVPVTSKLKPPVSHQYAIGTAVRLPWDLDLTVEGFYKSMDNLIAYKDGASFLGNTSTSWENKVEMGRGWAYGAEFMLEKSVGKTTGWLGYTLAKSERQFEHINYGKVFPAHYDRRHDLSAVLTHKFSDRFDIGMTWVYSTGNAVTLGGYTYPANLVDYGGRNSYRMPSYHRMDVGMNFHKQKKRGIRTWNVSLYNAYSRQNPFLLSWQDKTTEVPVYDDNGSQEGVEFEFTKELTQLSLFPIIPSVSYTFKF